MLGPEPWIGRYELITAQIRREPVERSLFDSRHEIEVTFGELLARGASDALGPRPVATGWPVCRHEVVV
jgi:hypothetical protein